MTTTEIEAALIGCWRYDDHGPEGTITGSGPQLLTFSADGQFDQHDEGGPATIGYTVSNHGHWTVDETSHAISVVLDTPPDFHPPAGVTEVRVVRVFQFDASDGRANRLISPMGAQHLTFTRQ